MKRAAFLDRDGVINRKPREGEYVTRWEEMRILPGVAKAVAALNRAGFRVIVVTNQRCVAKGLITTRELESMHEQMRQALARDGAAIDEIYYCPHEREACACRKPAPGMLLAAAQDHDLELSESWMIGDSDIDTEAGRSAGCKTARLAGRGERVNARADLYAKTLLEAVGLILRSERSSGTQKKISPARKKHRRPHAAAENNRRRSREKV